MPNKVYVLQLILASVDGKSHMPIPVKAYSSMETAQEAARLRSEVMREVLGYRIFSEQGDTGITVAGLLRDLGLHGINHAVDGLSVHEGNVITPQSNIIIPG